MHQKNKIWIAVLIAVFFCVAGVWYLLWGRDGLADKTGEEDGVDSVFATLTGTPAETPVEAPAEADTLPRTIYVYVCGAVVNPGVYELLVGSRLFEVLALAGGCLPETDEAYHNLAREVFDGERIYILSKEESSELSLKERVEGEQVEQIPSGTGTGELQYVINLNTATVAQLTTLPGIGESRAESIIEYRTKVGRFLDIEEIMNISGIGESMFEKIRDRITVE